MKNYSSQSHIEILGSFWIKALKCLYSENGLAFSETSVGKAKVINGLKIEGQHINADVKGADAELYKIKIIGKEVDKNIKEKIKNIILSHPSIASDISLGYFSESFKDLIVEEALCIFPQNLDDIKVSCSCGGNFICSHAAAVYDVLEKKINKNPFIILNLRGIPTAELIEAAGFKNYYIGKLNKNIHNKFIPASEVVFNREENVVSEKFTDFSFPETDINSLFFILPNNPLFFERKDFKAKLINIYETVETESESILIPEKVPPVRDTEFYSYYSDDNVLKAFVTPVNSFLYYLKSKGSRVRFTVKTLTIPVFDENEQKISLREKEGIIVPTDIVFDYFLYRSLSAGNDEITSSARFLNITASLAVALMKSLSFIPEVVTDNGTDFNIRYVPVFGNADIDEAVAYHKSVMPANFMFKNNGNNVLSQEASYDILSMFLTYLIRKVTFLRASKFKNDNITGIFTKPHSLAAITEDGKNIALSIADWLNVIFGKNQNIRPVLRIESSESGDDFSLFTDIINTGNNDIIPLSRIFETEEEIFSTPVKQVRFDIIRQIMVASDYLPVLKDILDSKGLEIAVIDLKETLEIISTVSVFLNALEIKVIIPKELKKIISPRILLKSRLKNPDSFDVSSLFNTDNKSKLSFNELLNFSYEIAIGDEKISGEEFSELVKSADGIVKYKDSYILLKPEDINIILKKLNNPVPEFSDSQELLHSVFSGLYNGTDFDADDSFKRAIDDFLKIDEITVPEGLNGVLRPYQERGFKWLYSNSMRGFGSCMADDMGLGKTIQVISLLLKLKEENKLKNPALVVCPTTLLGNWYKECEKFAPSLKVFIYHGTERSLDLDGTDIALTTYGLLRNDTEIFKSKAWDFIIIDEAQNIKNPDAAQTVAVKSLITKTHIAMTGTPVENRLSELWSIFDFTNKGYLGTLRSFRQNYAVPVEKFKDEERTEKLKLATSPFTLRRLKSDKSIISDLPEKIIFDEYCYLKKEQAALYEKVLENSFKTMKSKTGINRKGHIFKLITSLKQICNHPVQYTKTDKLTKDLSGKTEKLFSILEQIREQNEKAIIFTQYKVMGDLLVRMIKDEFKTDVPFFHGSLSRTARDETVEAFQTCDDIKLMIISLKAGGTGLNLTAATNVIHYDLWWNPAVEDQATDRTYRIGQTSNVIVYRMITLGTFEEKIDEMIKSKKELADLTVSTGEKLITELSDHELKEIFNLTKF